MKRQYGILTVIMITLAVFLTACGSETDGVTKVEESNFVRPENVDFETSEVDWRTFELTDLDGDSFKISDFDNKAVFVETFAVWCLNCKKQQGFITELHDELGDDVITIAIEIDPNAVESNVANYVAENGFESRYVVAPKEFTQSLVGEFGAQVVSAPSVPMLYICRDQVTFLHRGLKPVSELKELVEECNA